MLFILLQEVIRRFPDGLPVLDPIEDMNIKEDGLKKIVKVRLCNMNGESQAMREPTKASTFFFLDFRKLRCLSTVCTHIRCIKIHHWTLCIHCVKKKQR